MATTRYTQRPRMGAPGTATSRLSGSQTTLRRRWAISFSSSCLNLAGRWPRARPCAVVESVKAASDVYARARRAGERGQYDAGRRAGTGQQRSDRQGVVLQARARRQRRLRGADERRRLPPPIWQARDGRAGRARRTAENQDGFVNRHIGPSEIEIAAMLTVVGAESLDDLATRTVPALDPRDVGARPAASGRRGRGHRRAARAVAKQNSTDQVR